MSTARQEEIIRRAREALPADERLAAAWLEGSFVTDTADPWSDVDLHVAVKAGHFEGRRVRGTSTLRGREGRSRSMPVRRR